MNLGDRESDGDRNQALGDHLSSATSQTSASSTGGLYKGISAAASALIPPLAVFLAVLAIWHFGVRFFDIPAVLLPSPVEVARAIVKNWVSLLQAASVTAASAITGLLASAVVGVAIGMLFSQSELIRRSLYPYPIFLQTVPIVAIAPLIVIWIGEGFWAVATIAFIISLFPIITNATDGLMSHPRELRELFVLNEATCWQTLWLLQLPSALPRIVTGLKISSATAVLGSIVGEFFAGAGAKQPGLGYLIFAAKGQYRLDFLFAAILTCTLLGICIFTVVSRTSHRLLIAWADTSETE